MKIFVLGATGFQGSKITEKLMRDGHKITTLKRPGHRTKTLNPDIKTTEGSLENIDALNKALNETDAAVYTFPIIFDIDLAKEYTKNFILAAKKQEVPHIIFNSGFDLPDNGSSYLSLKLKLEIKKLLNSSGLNVTTLVPDIYIDNLSAPWSIPVILNDGILAYPVKSANKVPWISHSDLARYVASAIKKPDLAGSILPIGGNILYGEEIASAISEHIQKPLKFISLSPDEFQKQISPAFGELAGMEISNLYRYVENHMEHLISKNFIKTQEILEVKPESLTDWVKSVNWKGTD